MKTELKAKGYAIVSPTSEILNWTFHKQRKYAIEEVTKCYERDWAYLKSYGYTVKKAELTIKLEEK